MYFIDAAVQTADSLVCTISVIHLFVLTFIGSSLDVPRRRHSLTPSSPCGRITVVIAREGENSCQNTYSILFKDTAKLPDVYFY